MGGLLVALAVQRRPVDFAGIIMASPLLAPHKALMPWYKKLATKILGRVLPSVPIAALDLALYARDPDVLSYMASDPLRFHGNIPLVWPAALFKAQDDFAARLSYIQVPILLQVPSDDRVCDVAAMKKFFDALPSKYKEMKIYEGSYHSIFAEPEGIKEQAFNDVAEWLRERLLAVKLHTSHSQTGTTVASTPTSFSNSEV
ncbi:monoacylglycerol lipase-like [Amblyomma americanum]